MPNMDDCCDMNHRMGENYNKVEMLMSYLYEKMQAGQAVDVQEILLNLGDIGQSMLSTQSDFVQTYGKSDINIQNIMSQQIANKANALAQANDQVRGRNY